MPPSIIPIPRMSMSPAPGSPISARPKAATRCTRSSKTPPPLTDSMKMFKMGLEGGKPSKGQEGVQPEWFYKGDGSTLVAPGGDLVSPAFALDGGEEPEIVGVYLIDARRRAAPARLRARQRVLRPRHRAAELSLSRPFQAAPLELRPGVAARRPARRRARRLAHQARQGGDLGKAVPLRRAEHVALDRQSGGASFQICAVSPPRRSCMCISSAPRRCQFSDGIKPEKGDVFEIEAEAFGLPLRNRLTIAKPAKVRVAAL